MKYQCLRCGAVISEKKESCPECSSVKLLSIEEPLSEKEREELLITASKEITLLIQDVFVREEEDKEEESAVDIEKGEEDREDSEGEKKKGGAEGEVEEDNEKWDEGVNVLNKGVYEINLEDLMKSSDKEKGHLFFGKKKKEI